MTIIDWRGHDARRSPQFYARVGPVVLKRWPQPYRRPFHVRWGRSVLLGVDLARYELEVWGPSWLRRRPSKGRGLA